MVWEFISSLITGFGETILHTAPYLIAIGLLCAGLSRRFACNRDLPWWRSPDLATDLEAVHGSESPCACAKIAANERHSSDVHLLSSISTLARSRRTRPNEGLWIQRLGEGSEIALSVDGARCAA